MKFKQALHRLLFSLPVFLLFLVIVSCRGKGNGAAPGVDSERPVYSGSAWPALALLKTGENPIWFELTPDGPGLIEYPAAAALLPFTPWPHARFVAGMQIWNGFVVMAVNRDGFLVLGPAAETGTAARDLIMYRAASAGLWDPYTAESFFTWENKPALLLYRNDFFTEPAATPIRPQVFVLDSTSPVPLGIKVPALESFPPGGAWEAELVQRGPDGLWYYRMKEKGKAENETAYFRTGDLAEKGIKISPGEWRDSNQPEDPANAPMNLAVVLNRAASVLNLEGTIVIRTTSPDFEGMRFIRAGAAEAAAGAGTEPPAPALLYGYSSVIHQTALAVQSDGRGLYSRGREASVRPFSLPLLPEGFVYTGIALLGNVLVASWEEQQEAGIAAAGFLTQAAVWR